MSISPSAKRQLDMARQRIAAQRVRRIKPVRWTSGIGLAIADAQRRHRASELGRTHFIIGHFLNYAMRLDAAGALPNGMSGVVTDLHLDECGVREYVEFLIEESRHLVTMVEIPLLAGEDYETARASLARWLRGGQ